MSAARRMAMQWDVTRAESRITYPFLSPFIGNRNRYREMFIVHNKQELENNTNIFLPNDRGLNSAQGVQILCHSLYQGSDEWHNLLTFKERFNSAFQIKSDRKSVTLLWYQRKWGTSRDLFHTQINTYAYARKIHTHAHSWNQHDNGVPLTSDSKTLSHASTHLHMCARKCCLKGKR